MKSLLERLDSESPRELERRSRESLEWFRKNTRRLKITSERFYKQSHLPRTNKYIDGRFYTYFYNPEYAAKLPYYDRFPCVLIIERYQNGFLGLNFHYIPPRMRVKLLYNLFEFAIHEEKDERAPNDPALEGIGSEDNETNRIRMNYRLLNTITKLRFFKPCLKRYRYDKILGRALEVEPKYWDIMAMLPTAQWEKTTASSVYRDARQMVNA